MSRIRRLPLLSVLALGALSAVPAHAVGGGTALPFNDALTLIQDNLTGPTANTIIVVLIVAALVTVGMSREGSWLKPLGGCIVVSALLAKAAVLPGVLGLGAAVSIPYAYRFPALATSSLWLLTTVAVLLPWLPRKGRSLNSASARS